MKKIRFFSSWILLIGLLSCGGADEGRKSVVADPQSPVAELDGQPIRQEELQNKIAGPMLNLEMQAYEIKKRGLESLIQQKLVEKEAKKRGVTPEALLKAEVQDKVGEIAESDLRAVYDQNKARIGDRSFEEVKEPIRQQLFARQASIYQENFLTRLQAQAKIKILLESPRFEVSVDDDPMKGKKDAPITIVEFTDYQCPFCNQARPVMKRVLETYGDKIRYVLRDYPLDFHDHAQKAAEAAQCAGNQGKYWEYGDILWENQGKLETADLKQYATRLKLDQAKFEACLDQGKYAAEVKKDEEDGAKLGVSGTPSFFINGRMLTGAQPFEQFKEIIDAELKTVRK
jgi:protein-disulfide isomerase